MGASKTSGKNGMNWEYTLDKWENRSNMCVFAEGGETLFGEVVFGFLKLSRVFEYHIAGWSSLVARRAHNPEAAGSNPAPATNNAKGLRDCS